MPSPGNTSYSVNILYFLKPISLPRWRDNTFLQNERRQSNDWWAPWPPPWWRRDSKLRKRGNWMISSLSYRKTILSLVSPKRNVDNISIVDVLDKKPWERQREREGRNTKLRTRREKWWGRPSERRLVRPGPAQSSPVCLPIILNSQTTLEWKWPVCKLWALSQLRRA